MQTATGKPMFSLRYRAEALDQRGRSAGVQEGEARSLVRAWGAVVQALLSGADVAGVTNIAAAVKELDASALIAGGCKVAMGTDDTPVAMIDAELGAEDSSVAATVSKTADGAGAFTIVAHHAIESVAGLTAKEIGLYLELGDTGPGTSYFLAARDVLVAPIVVPALGALIVSYTFTYVP